MLGETERVDAEGSFSKANILKRILIVFAGGFINILFGLIIYFILISSNGTFISTTVNSLTPKYAAEIVGIKPQDKILKIDSKKVMSKQDIDELINNSNGKELIVKVKRANETIDFKLKPTEEINKLIGIYLGVQNENLSNQIKSIYLNSPAEQVGLKAGDRIIKIDDIDTNEDPYKVVKLISESKNEKIKVTVNRNNEIIDFNVKPETKSIYYLGVSLNKAENTLFNNIYYGFWDTLNFSVSILDNLKQIFSGEVTKDQLMGPVRNFRYGC